MKSVPLVHPPLLLCPQDAHVELPIPEQRAHRRHVAMSKTIKRTFDHVYSIELEALDDRIFAKRCTMTRRSEAVRG